MAARKEQEILTAAGREIAISNPRKVLFPRAGYTKLDVARYYLAVAAGALGGAGGRRCRSSDQAPYSSLRRSQLIGFCPCSSRPFGTRSR